MMVVVAVSAACSGTSSSPSAPKTRSSDRRAVEPAVGETAPVTGSLTSEPAEAPPDGSFEAVRALLIQRAPETVDDIRHLVGEAPEKCEDREGGQGWKTCVWILPSTAGPRELKADIYGELVSSFSLGDGVQRLGAGYSIGLINPGAPLDPP